MADYTITFTDTEVKSLKTVMSNIDDWLTTAGKNRAQHAKQEIIAKLVNHCNANGIAIATGEDAQVDQAYELKVVEELTDEEPSLPGE